jgi:hypothetical protein
MITNGKKFDGMFGLSGATDTGGLFGIGESEAYEDSSGDSYALGGEGSLGGVVPKKLSAAEKKWTAQQWKKAFWYKEKPVPNNDYPPNANTMPKQMIHTAAKALAGKGKWPSPGRNYWEAVLGHHGLWGMTIAIAQGQGYKANAEEAVDAKVAGDKWSKSIKVKSRPRPKKKAKKKKKAAPTFNVTMPVMPKVMFSITPKKPAVKKAAPKFSAADMNMWSPGGSAGGGQSYKSPAKVGSIKAGPAANIKVVKDLVTMKLPPSVKEEVKAIENAATSTALIDIENNIYKAKIDELVTKKAPLDEKFMKAHPEAVVLYKAWLHYFFAERDYVEGANLLKSMEQNVQTRLSMLASGLGLSEMGFGKQMSEERRDAIHKDIANSNEMLNKLFGVGLPVRRQMKREVVNLAWEKPLSWLLGTEETTWEPPPFKGKVALFPMNDLIPRVLGTEKGKAKYPFIAMDGTFVNTHSAADQDLWQNFGKTKHEITMGLSTKGLSPNSKEYKDIVEAQQGAESKKIAQQKDGTWEAKQKAERDLDTAEDTYASPISWLHKSASGDYEKKWGKYSTTRNLGLYEDSWNSTGYHPTFIGPRVKILREIALSGPQFGKKEGSTAYGGEHIYANKSLADLIIDGTQTELVIMSLLNRQYLMSLALKPFTKELQEDFNNFFMQQVGSTLDTVSYFVSAGNTCTAEVPDEYWTKTYPEDAALILKLNAESVKKFGKERCWTSPNKRIPNPHDPDKKIWNIYGTTQPNGKGLYLWTNPVLKYKPYKGGYGEGHKYMSPGQMIRVMMADGHGLLAVRNIGKPKLVQAIEAVMDLGNQAAQAKKLKSEIVSLKVTAENKSTNDIARSKAKAEAMADAFHAEADTSSVLAQMQKAMTAQTEELKAEVSKVKEQISGLLDMKQGLQANYAEAMEAGMQDEMVDLNVQIAGLGSQITQLLVKLKGMTAEVQGNAWDSNDVGNKTQNHLDLADETKTLSEEEEGKKNTYKNEKGNDVDIKTKKSDTANDHIEVGVDVANDAAAVSNQAYKDTLKALEDMYSELGSIGADIAVGVGTKIHKEVVKADMEKHIKDDVVEKKKFPWLLLAAGALGVTQAVPLAVAAGVGAVGLLAMRKKAPVDAASTFKAE